MTATPPDPPAAPPPAPSTASSPAPPPVPPAGAPRFYCPDLAAAPATGSLHQLPPDEARHARRVLRLGQGDGIELFDGDGWSARCIIQSSPGHTVSVRVVASHQAPPPRPRLTVAAAVPKGSRADDMVEAMSQSGASAWIPLLTQRSVVEPRPAKLDRWRRAAIESAKQCGRAHVLHIEPPTPLTQAIHRTADVKLLLHPGGGGADETKRVERDLRAAGEVLVLIGPEGGWSDEELRTAIAADARPWTIAPHVLRIETAASASCALVRYLTLHAPATRQPA